MVFQTRYQIYKIFYLSKFKLSEVKSQINKFSFIIGYSQVMYVNQSNAYKNTISTLNNSYTLSSHQTLSNKFQLRSSYGGKTTNQNKEYPKSFLQNQRMRTQPDATISLNQKYQIKSVAELKESRDTTNTMSDSRTKDCGNQIAYKTNIRIQYIGNLLSKFKTKFASIQQKYSLPIKNNDTQISTRIQPITPQCSSFQSQFNSRTNKLFLLQPNIPISKTPNITTYYKSNFTLASQNPVWTEKKVNSIILDQKEKEILKNNTQIYSPTVDTRNQNKIFERATFGAISNPLLQYSRNRVNKEQQSIFDKSRIHNCKNVESQTEDNELEDESHQSIVIQKFSPELKKLKRTQTLSNNQVFESNSEQLLKRMHSLRENPLQTNRYN